MHQIRLGLLGGGTVGGGVFQALKRNGGLISSRLGMKFKVVSVAVKDPQKPRKVRISPQLLTDDWRKVVENPSVDLVVELMGGVDLARTAVLAALKNGKPVVTANKALLSEFGEEIFEVANQNKTNVYYEASVAGGIPIIKIMREALIGNRIERVYGILNGTCNYILTRMKLEGGAFKDILADAQRLGYAETEPSLDVDGLDAMHKTGLLASLAYGFWVNQDCIHVEGIRNITPLDISFAEQLGYSVKLLAVIKNMRQPSGKTGGCPRVQVGVHPTLVPSQHVLASVNGVFNAVYISGDIVGDTLYYGHGAGQDATASSVLSDLADAALDLKFGTNNRIPPFVPHENGGAVLPFSESVWRYYLRLNVIDRPGCLAKISAILAEANIGISSVIQPEGHEGKHVPLILMIHDASDQAMHQALALIENLPVVKGKPVMMRVESFV